MARLTRRHFLGLSAAGAGAAAIGKLPSLLRAAMAAAPAGGSVSSVKHVVVLMQENRSFDHYFGTLRGVRGFADRTAIRLRDGNEIFRQSDSSGRATAPFRGAAGCLADLDHSWDGTHRAWNQGRHDRWIAAKGRGTMASLTRADISYHYALADSFTLCDNYFCSVMGPTEPNRLYLWSGTIDPQARAGGPAVDNSRSDLRWTTYPERLQAAGVSWKVYQNANDNYDDNALAWFRQFQNARPGSALYDRGLASVPAITGTTASDIAAALEYDVVNGTLPFVSWIVAPEECSEHPTHPPAQGADFIARVLAALTADPEVWASTVLLINYDENDGFFDHVPPPVPAPGTPDEFVAGQPIGLGPRVPMLIVSPWSRGGYVCSEVFDHTSVIRFLEVLTGVTEPNISTWRRQVCGDLTSAFDFTTIAPGPPVLPASAPPSAASCHTSAVPLQDTLLQEAGDRPARALPYQPNASCEIDHRADKIHLRMTNAGNRCVHMSVYANDGADNGPWQFDVAAGDDASGVHFELPVPFGGNHDLSVHGPNGFLRRFAGDLDPARARLEATTAYDFSVPGHARLVLTLINDGDTETVFTIRSNAYLDAGPWSLAVPARQTASIDWDVQLYTNGWYDLTITADTTPAFVRRCAGHIETGLASISG
jgi:phospholipase C